MATIKLHVFISLGIIALLITVWALPYLYDGSIGEPETRGKVKAMQDLSGEPPPETRTSIPADPDPRGRVAPVPQAEGSEHLRHVYGRVLTLDGQPIEGATVSLSTEGGVRQQTTDPSGRYRLQVDWDAGKRPPSIVAYAPGHAPHRASLGRQYRVLQRGGDGTRTQHKLDLKLVAGGTILGRVRGPGGFASGAKVHAYPVGKTRGHGRVTWTNAKGEFVMRTPASGSHHLIEVIHRTGGRGSSGPHHVGVEVRDVGVVWINPGDACFVSGRILYADGSPVRGLSVAVAAVEKSPDSFALERGEAKTDELGIFRVPGFAPKREFHLFVPGSLQAKPAAPPKLISNEYRDSIVVGFHRIRVSVQGAEPAEVKVNWTQLTVSENGVAARATAAVMQRLRAANFVGFESPQLERFVDRGSTWLLDVSHGERRLQRQVHADPGRNETAVEVNFGRSGTHK